ncbi:hypothetical protein AVEN_53606-1 [Araneus ventricosus]|uniref:C2H2-type domain-containing protein n=1 Tax=Araneus ventricosus TaxID=182803 RepID=A0A4Y2Q8K3_ARAVE|nr:hypothetical protein AVEN_53606-1 [Araneus ventricosus]
MRENDNEEAQHQRISEVSSKVCNNRSNVFADNAVSLASISDADPITGHSRMNVEVQWRTEYGNIFCPERGKRFSREGHFVVHYRTLTGEKPFPCDRYDKRLSKKSNLGSHSRTHTGERPYKCPICEKAYTSSSKRNEHYKNVHKKK